LSYVDIVLWCVRPQDEPAALQLLRGLQKDVPGWRDKLRIVWLGSIRNFVYVSFRVIWQLSDNLVRSSPSP